jgi:hypothetical protein
MMESDVARTGIAGFSTFVSALEGVESLVTTLL